MALEGMDRSSQRPPRGGGRVLFLYRIADTTAGTLAVNRYRRRVALLKRLLPAVGVALLLLVAAWPRLLALWKSSSRALPPIDLRQARQLTMVDARFAGVDRQNRPYVVTAALARQLPKERGLLALDKPRAELDRQPGSRVVMTAGSGIYQSGAELLDLFGRVALLREDGARFETLRAHINLSADTARGEDPIAGRGPMGTISARGFRIRDKGKTILFTGKAKALLYARKEGAAAAPRSLPPLILKKAALLETAALAKLRPKKAGRAANSHARRRHISGRRPALRRLRKGRGDGG